MVFELLVGMDSDADTLLLALMESARQTSVNTHIFIAQIYIRNFYTTYSYIHINVCHVLYNVYTHTSINLYIYVYIDTEVHKKMNIWTHAYIQCTYYTCTHNLYIKYKIYTYIPKNTPYTSVSKHELITHTLYFL